MGSNRVRTIGKTRGLVAMLSIFAVLLATTSPVTARQGDAGPSAQDSTSQDPAYQDPADSDPAYSDPAYSDPAYSDPGYEDPAYSDPTYSDPATEEGFYGDPCDPAVHPDWANDPYCNPALYDDGSTPNTTYIEVEDGFYGDPCDPAVHPDWANDPYCNPDLSSTTVGPASVPTPSRVANQTSGAGSTPLIEIDVADAPAVGAERMLLAIDAIAELGGFERAVTPAGASLLRDIQQGIPAGGLDEDGYSAELESFVLDFLPFLESLEASGVVVSESLWTAVIDLEAVILGSEEIEQTEPGLLKPAPWLFGLGDLLVRGGEEAFPPAPDQDAIAIRALVAEFALLEEEPTPPTTSEPSAPTTTPERLALAEDPIDEAAPSSTGPSIAVIGGGLALLLFIVAAGLLFVRKRSKASGHPDRAGSTGRTAAAEPNTTPDAKASVSELLEASRRMSASLDVATIATIALAEAKQIVGAEGGIVVRRTDDGLDPVACDPPMLFNYDKIDSGCLRRVIETGRATAAIAYDEPLLIEVPMAMGAVPIVTDGVITGAILVVRVSSKPFDREELDALEMLAPLVGSAFAAADTHETATELVDVEPLTGLQNRRRLDLDLAAISTDDAVAYVMIDIDHFKNFNDTNGHAAGDEALRQVSALLQASVRPKDLVYRYGGEEFCVLLPGATAEDAAVVAERARAAVEGAEIPGMENQPAGRVTISVGVSDSAFGTPGDLVERADAALYESKRNGRNRVTLSSAD